MIKIIFSFLACFLFVNCAEKDDPMMDPIEVAEDELVEELDFKLPEIDLAKWKVTLPIGNPTEVAPPEILDYATNPLLKPFFYNDSVEGALVFYTYPDASTANSSYSRTELREQMTPGSNSDNWTFTQGGKMKGTLAVPDISKDANGKSHRTIVMQIHGRLTDAQRDLIEAPDHNAPPILKIYWVEGKVRVKSKVVKNADASLKELLPVSAWDDDEGFTFPEFVGNDLFTLEIIASKGRMEVILNEKDAWIKEDVSLEKWEVFENYFKAGNYLASKEKDAFAYVKYYDLKVSH
ncbi:polysaccharide lyase family 7 protein [Namhaeicola litoreus]|uniref:Polysaccharide lyase family 7 protein n=1 Tax=Namhaeicola litoreus TaxID=1052145 RepID=A0ABW3XZW7_9FLAO